MSLAMARAERDPATGMFELRRRIPADILRARDQLAAMGITFPSTHVKRSLKTREGAEAKRERDRVNAEWDAQWERWRRLLKAQAEGQVTLTQLQTFQVSAHLGAGVIEVRKENPGDPSQLAEMRERVSKVATNPPQAERDYMRWVLQQTLPNAVGIAELDDDAMDRLVRQHIEHAPGIVGEHKLDADVALKERCQLRMALGEDGAETVRRPALAAPRKVGLELVAELAHAALAA